MSKRLSYARAVLGKELVQRLGTTRVLMVGAGGIGCELLKNVVTAGFGYIEIIDLDTIDLSNLNRQFLFRKEHVKRPKALVAQETAQHFNPHVKIQAIHGNIKEPRFNVDYFQSFDIVLNALDNMDARRHVNKMCIAAGVPLIESGTAGYAGQVQPIMKDRTECYDCTGKPVPKGYAVCTIRSTPSTPIHCIVWAKSYLFPQLFGPEEENDNAELDEAAKDGENAGELAELRREANATKEMRSTLAEPGAEQRVFDKVFKKDIERLLSMEDMWKHRKPPAPLSYAVLSQQAAQTPSSSAPTASGIKDQRELSLGDAFGMFQDSLKKLTARVQAGGPNSTLDWDKDDDDALDFATAAANLRAHIFDIPSKTRFDVKEMAGNIIPAIATTNAIVAGVLVLQCLKALQGKWSESRVVWVSRANADKAISPSDVNLPNPSCAVCRTPYIHVKVNTAKLTVGTFVKEVVKDSVGLPGDVSLVEGSRIILDPDFDDNEDKTFEHMGLVEGTLLTVNDEEGDLESIVFLISNLLDSEKDYVLPDTLPTIPAKAPLAAPAAAELEEKMAEPASIAGRKRSADDAELGSGTNGTKKAKVDSVRVDDTGVVHLDDSDDEVTMEHANAGDAESNVIELD